MVFNDFFVDSALLDIFWAQTFWEANHWTDKVCERFVSKKMNPDEFQLPFFESSRVFRTIVFL